jgi:glycosyltransferase involved in cell wall biosynthesis/GT2 family glycosyltransferase
MNEDHVRPRAIGERIVDIIVPVHRDAPSVRRALASVLASRNRPLFEVVAVVDDATDRPFAVAAADLLRDPRMSVLRAGRSLDYAGMVNRGCALHGARDVVVLQSDAEVAGDWLDRLAAHAGAAAMGVVGTFTNAAGIARYPRADANSAVPQGCAPAALDALFARVNRGQAATAPGVHGPCLYITRACLASVGGMRAVATDDGHASEVDFSLRARERGFETCIAGDTFVANDGEGSFGDRTLRQETHAATPALAHLHPDHEALGRELLDADGLRLCAGRVDIARLAASPRPAIVFVSHAWGGGIRRYMDDLAALVRDRADVLYLEPADADTVKLHWPREGEGFAAWFRLPGDLPLLAATLRAMGVARLHFHHVHGLPQSILQLPRESGLPYDCTLHDYYAICPQYHLADQDGRYCGEPDRTGCAACLAERPAPWGLGIDAWREALGELLRRAARVIAPSQDVATRIARYVPGLAIDVWPHPERAARVAAPVVRVVTLGNLSREKGLDVVARCAQDAKLRGLPLAFRVLGATTEPIEQSPEAPLTIHGSYPEQALPHLVAAERADVLFFPAQVPETYSYTLSTALATRTPIVASALGAFGERLAGRAHTRLFAWDSSAEQWNAALLEVAGAVRRTPGDAALAGVAPVGAMP